MLRRALLAAPLALAVRPARAAEASVTIDNFVFTPPVLTVAAGTKVTWTNRDDIPHSVVSAAQPPLFKAHVMDTDETFERVFDTKGTFPYFCGLHPHMQGTVIVT